MIINGKVPKKHLLAIDHFAELLFTPARIAQLELTIRYKNLDVFGLVYIDNYNLKGKPDSFIIEINRCLNIDDKLKTLAHEMVHVKQYSSGYLNESMTRWRGEKVSDYLDYENKPWEVEAEFFGLNLYESFVANYQ
jgi:hypothetical protein